MFFHFTSKRSFPLLTFPFSLPGFHVQEERSLEHGLVISAHSMTREAACPSCGHISHRLHSYYTRSPHDVPLSGQTVQLETMPYCVE
jgi:transposase